MFEVHRREGPNKKDIRIYYLSAPTQEEMQSWIGIIQTLKDTKEKPYKPRQQPEQQVSISSAGSSSSPPDQATPPNPALMYNLVKNRSASSVHVPGPSGLATIPRLDASWGDPSRLRVTIAESGGVRNRMFTETGQLRKDIAALHMSMDTSDEEEMEKG